MHRHLIALTLLLLTGCVSGLSGRTGGNEAATWYADESVFTVRPVLDGAVRRHEVTPGLTNAPLYESLFHVSVIQFNDDGTCVRPAQIDAAAEAIRRVRESSPHGVIVVTFIHGWHHSAEWHRTPSTLATDPDGDRHFHSFRLVLESLALRETERSGSRRVIGIYLGWDGDPASGFGGLVSGVSGLTHTTFWNRYSVAEQIGRASAFRKCLQQIVSSTKQWLPPTFGSESPLVLMGHSMGALILESSVLDLLKDPADPLFTPSLRQPGGAVEVRTDRGPVSFPDLILALNSAADSRIAKGIEQELKRRNLTKWASDGRIGFSPPIMMSVTSSGDTDTGDMWRYAQGVHLWSRRTDGHDRSLFTHSFELTSGAVTCRPRDLGRDFGQNWHCLREPDPLVAPSPAIAIDLPVREREGVHDLDVPHARYTITPEDVNQAAGLWVFQVPPEIIKDHNDIFNSKARSLTLGLIQISGAVASLADDWGDSFEPE